MNNLKTLALASAVAGAAFFGGLAIGKSASDAKFIANDELKFDDVGGPKIATFTGDYKKGPYTGILKLPAGFTSPLHTHTGDYEGVIISGTMTHWFKGEDGTKAKKLAPGSYWKIPGGVPHISACAAGAECVFYIWQTKGFDFQAIDDKGKVIVPPKK